MKRQSYVKFIKKVCSVLLSILLLIPFLFGCSKSIQKNNPHTFDIICTTFPHYDWMRQIIGDTEGVTLSLLISNGTDPHSYEPTIADIAALNHSDMVVLVGGDSDTWIKEALAQSENKDLIQVKLNEMEGVTLQKITSESGHNHAHEHEHEHDGHDHSPYDEHIWLSLRNAAACVRGLTSTLANHDPTHAESYQANADRYLQALEDLDRRYVEAVASAAKRELLFADRFPFIYLTEDYGLHVHAAFDGCTTDVNASFATIVSLAKEVSELCVTKIMVTEASDQKLAEAVIRATERSDLSILAMNSLQSITNQGIQDGATYLSIMEENLSVLKEALS